MPACVTSWPALLNATQHDGDDVVAVESRVLTLAYFWNTQRCGVHARVDSTRATTILTPFFNPTFTNTWSTALSFALPGGAAACNFAEYVAARVTRDPRYTPLTPSCKWWAGAGVLASEAGPWTREWEGATPAVLLPLQDMLQEVARDTRAPHVVEFMLNPRDAPQVGRAGACAAPFLPGPRLRAAKYRRAHVPLLRCLSFYGSGEHEDVLMPCVADWLSAQSEAEVLPPWHARARVACFYGSATGAGITTATNQRLAFAEAARVGPLAGRLRCGITSWNARDKVIIPATEPRGAVVSCIAPEAFAFRLAEWTPLAAQAATCRYLVYIAGHAAASRLGALLRTGCLVLRTATLPGVAGAHWMDAYLQGARVSGDGRGAGATDVTFGTADHLQLDADFGNLGATLDWADAHEEEAYNIAARGAERTAVLLTRAFMAAHVASAVGCG